MWGGASQIEKRACVKVLCWKQTWSNKKASEVKIEQANKRVREDEASRSRSHRVSETNIR